MDLRWQSNVSVFNMLSRLVITFLTRSKCLLISWLQLTSAVIWNPEKYVTSWQIDGEIVETLIIRELQIKATILH